jgi:hypothetical protein
LDARFQRGSTVEAAPLQDEALLFHPEVNRFYVLNGTASYIWDRLKEPASAEEIAEQICRTYAGVAQPEALRDVEGVLQQMVAMSVVTLTSPGPRKGPATNEGEAP